MSAIVHSESFLAALGDFVFRALDAVFNVGNPKTPDIPSNREAQERRLRAIDRLSRWRRNHDEAA